MPGPTARAVAPILVGREGFEPSTSRLSSARSNQLSYQPACLFRKGCAGGDVPGCCGQFRYDRSLGPSELILRKEVIQPQVPLRLPCYDFTPVADPTVVGCLLAVSAPASGRTNSHGVTGGVYKARERIHRGVLIRDY
jgi:hypothetical protein